MHSLNNEVEPLINLKVEEVVQLDVNLNYLYEDNDIQAILLSRLNILSNDFPHFFSKPVHVLAAVDDILDNQLEQRLRQEKSKYEYERERVLLIPCNLGNFHWVGIYFEFGIDGIIKSVKYTDSINSGVNISKRLLKQIHSVYPDFLVEKINILIQDDITSCGAYMIENLIILFTGNEKLLDASERNARQIRRMHLRSLQITNEKFFEKFYIQQLKNVTSASNLCVQLGYLKNLNCVKLSPQELNRITEVCETLEYMPESLKTKLKSLFKFKAEYKDNHQLHLNNIRNVFDSVLKDITNQNQSTQDRFKKMIYIIFDLDPNAENLTLFDKNFRVGYEEILAIGLSKQTKSALNKNKNLISRKIEDDADLSFRLQEEFYENWAKKDNTIDSGEELLVEPKGTRSKPFSIYNRHLFFAIFWLIISIGFGAVSTVWAYELLIGTGPSTTYLYLGLLIGTSFLNTIPAAIGATQLKKAEFLASKRFVSKFVDTYKNEPELILDKNFKDESEPSLIKQHREVVLNAQRIIYGTVNGFAILAIDMVTMSILVDPFFAVGYAASSLCYLGSVLAFKGKVKSLSEVAYNQDNHLTNILKNGWYNIVIGNNYNLTLWSNKYKETYRLSRNASVSHIGWVRAGGAVGTIVALVPILAVFGWTYLTNLRNVDKIALLLATFPRQLQTFQFLKELSNALTERAGVWNKLNGLKKLVQKPKKDKVHYSILPKKITVYFNNIPKLFSSIDEFLHAVEKQGIGRITIRGSNKAGKSVLLCKLYEFLSKNKGNEIFYFPPADRHILFQSSMNANSSGGKMKAELVEVIENVQANFILLDEWDSHLDSKENMPEISGLLDKLSQKKCIVEIRHRDDELSILENKSSFEIEKAQTVLVFSTFLQKNQQAKITDKNLMVVVDNPPLDQIKKISYD